jgi:hypothetical protein
VKIGPGDRMAIDPNRVVNIQGAAAQTREHGSPFVIGER